MNTNIVPIINKLLTFISDRNNIDKYTHNNNTNIPINKFVFKKIIILIITYAKTTIISQTLSIISDRFAVSVFTVFKIVPLDILSENSVS